MASPESSKKNAAFCESPPAYDREESPATTIVSFVEGAKDDVKSRTHHFVSVGKSLFAGGVAGGVSRTAVAPLERLKILLQVQNSQNAQYRGMLQGLKHIFKTEGVAGFFVGNGINCARIIPNSAVKFVSYDYTSKGLLWLYRKQSGNSEAEQNPLLRLAAGACAGIIAMSATYPMDMVRGRLTVQVKDAPNSYNGMVHAARTIVKEEGARALYKGWLPSVIGVIPYVGLNFAVYESLKDWLIKSEFLGPVENDLPVLTKLGCGAVAGATGQTVAYPLDVIRRRMQMGDWKEVAKPDGTMERVKYAGMVDAFKQTVRTDGFTALYKGLVPNSVKVVPCIALAFVTYETLKDMLKLELRITD